MAAIRMGRWQIEFHQRTIHITRQPDPNCPDCSGSGGGWLPHRFGADWDECPCLDQLRTWSIPLWFRNRRQYVEEPF